jgi:hypothetical protein
VSPRRKVTAGDANIDRAEAAGSRTRRPIEFPSPASPYLHQPRPRPAVEVAPVDAAFHNWRQPAPWEAELYVLACHQARARELHLLDGLR